MKLLFVMALVVVCFGLAEAQEKLRLGTPITKTIAAEWVFDGASFSYIAGSFSATFQSDTGETKTCSEPDMTAARDTITQLNKANLTTLSLGQRLVRRYSGAGKCLGVGTETGTVR